MRHAARRRRGQALVEFSVIALFFAIMIGGMLSFGHMFFVANSLQQAVDVGAQEIARMPFSAAGDLGLGRLVDLSDSENVLSNDATFRQQIYDESYLVIDPNNPPDDFIDDDGDGKITPFENVSRMPLLNRLLLTSMVFDNGVYRYPGTVVTNQTTGKNTILIPILGDDGTVARWVSPVEEILPSIEDYESAAPTGPYSVAANPGDLSRSGIVALRINYPAQAAALVMYKPIGAGISDRVVADDADAQGKELPSQFSFAVTDGSITFGANAGQLGLGRLSSYRPGPKSEFGVRPYRRVISVQAIYRREVFE